MDFVRNNIATRNQRQGRLKVQKAILLERCVTKIMTILDPHPNADFKLEIFNLGKTPLRPLLPSPTVPTLPISLTLATTLYIRPFSNLSSGPYPGLI